MGLCVCLSEECIEKVHAATGKKLIFPVCILYAAA